MRSTKNVPVAPESLPWKEVEMIDMFDDAEGFYGLEEVDDIEVVRDGNRIQFVCHQETVDNTNAPS